MNPDGVTKPFSIAERLFYLEAGELARLSGQVKKSQTATAGWKDLGKANAKRIINPDGHFLEAGELARLSGQVKQPQTAVAGWTDLSKANAKRIFNPCEIQ